MSIIYICILNIKTRALCTKPRVPFPIHTIYWKCAAHQMASTQLNFRTRFWALLKTGKRCLRLSHVQKLILDTFYFLSVPFFDKIASKETSMPHFLVNILFRDKMHRYKKYTKKILSNSQKWYGSYDTGVLQCRSITGSGQIWTLDAEKTVWTCHKMNLEKFWPFY